MSQIKFSQKSIQGLPEALAALLASVNAQGTAGSTALTTAINAEIAARTAADTAISNVLDVVNGASTVDGSFRKAIADVIGSAPEALNTLKEIADYIAVNPSATVADAINAAITAANQSVADLTAVVDAEKSYSDYMTERTHRVKSATLTLAAEPVSGLVPVQLPATLLYLLNFETALITIVSTGVSYQLPVVYSVDTWAIDFSGYETEIGTVTGLNAKVQYVYKPSADQERAIYNS
jgi:hypothetical protein